MRGIYLLERVKFFFTLHFKKHLLLYAIAIFIFLIGLTSGAFTVNSISSNQKGGLADYISGFIANISNGINSDIDKKAIFLEGLRQYCGFSFMVWIFGLSYLGIPFIIVAFGIKGFLLGFTTGFLVYFYGTKGFFFVLVCVLPQNFIYIPCITIIVIIGLKNSINNYRQRKNSISKQYRKKDFALYTFKILIVTIVLIIGILYETFIAPLFLNIFSRILNN